MRLRAGFGGKVDLQLDMLVCFLFVAYRLVQTSNMVKEYMCFQLTTPLKDSLGKGVKPTCDDIHLNMLS